MPPRTLHGRARQWLTGPIASALVAASLMTPAVAPVVVAAEPTDMVLEWNANAIAAIGNAPAASPPGLGQPPPLQTIQLAIVQGAIYDAVNSIDGGHEPYLVAIDAAAGASQAAAAATAGHHALAGLVPGNLPQVTTSIDAIYAASLAKVPDGQAKIDGIAVGAKAAAAMLADRANDGRFGTRTFVAGTGPGEWRLVPPLSNNVFAWIADVKPFTLHAPGQFKTAGPYDMASAEYAAEFNEVKAVGGASSTRTVEQQALATFVSTNPLPLLNRALRDIATERGLSTSEQARLFALTTISAADAHIACWYSKNLHNFWRPQTAIREAGSDGNDATDADPTWSSAISNPGYPDNPSGYNCLAASTMYAARTYFGTNDIAFTLSNPASVPPTSRSYTSFTAFVADAIEGRILVGLHFRSADEQAATLGRNVARWVARHSFGPAE